MTTHPEFWDWVSNTVEGLSGIKPQHLCGPAWKQVLTYAESGSGACQVVSTGNFQPKYSASMRVSEEATTHIAAEPKKRDGHY